jgi:hypothetical protein
VFLPIVIGIRRRNRSGSSAPAKALAVLAAFAASGLAHEYIQFVVAHNLTGAALLSFLLHGVVVLSWVPLSWVVESAGRFLHVYENVAARTIARVAAHLCFMQFVLIITWIMLPALTGQGLPDGLNDMLDGWFAHR